MTNLQQLRNIGVSAHIDAGKTTLTERMLYFSGRIHKAGEVHDGNATMDSGAIERRRGITISSAATQIPWDDHTINIIDTPGHVDFTVEVERSLRVLDGAVLVLCAVGGVQSQTRTVDRQMRRHGVPRIALINKMDRAGADPGRVFEQLHERLGANPVAIQLPIGREGSFCGVVDLVEMDAVFFEGVDGKAVRRAEIPAELLDAAETARQQMLESLAMLDDCIMKRVLEHETPTNEDVYRVLSNATIERQITPVLYASAFKNIGVQALLDAVCRYLPRPTNRVIEIADQASDQQSELDPDSLVAMAFKTTIESFGQLTYLRLYQGRLSKGATVWLAHSQRKVRVGRLVRMFADRREEVGSASAGEIVGIVGLDCPSGETITSDPTTLRLEGIVAAEPVVQRSIVPVDRGDSIRLAKQLDRFRRDDPTFRVMSDPESGETLIAGMGQLHLEVYVERLQTEFGIKCETGPPRVAYRMRPTRPVEFDHRLKKQSGGSGEYAHLVGMLEPTVQEEADFEFESQITGGRISSRFVHAACDGFKLAFEKGPRDGYPVTGVRIKLCDGGEHEKDSSELAFRKCADEAVRDVILPMANLEVLEPVMLVRIDVPVDYQGAVTGQLLQLRGTVSTTETSATHCEITAEVPLANMFDFSSQLRSLTKGEGDFSMQPHVYRPCPREHVR